MARIQDRISFREYVLKKLGAPLVNLPIQTSVIDDCGSTGTTGTTGTTGDSGTNITTGGTVSCEDLAASVMTQLDLAIDDALDYFHQQGSGRGNEKAVLYIQMLKNQMYYDVPPCIVSIDQDMGRGASYRFDDEEAGEGVGLFSLQSQFGPRGVFSYLGAGSQDTLLTYEIAHQYNSMVDLRYTRKFQLHFHELQHKALIIPTPTNGDNGKVLAFMCDMKAPDEYCFSDIWVQRYAVALAMEQIGRNLSLYNGLQLPGGGEFNSGFYWDSGIEQREKLEEEMASAKWGSEEAAGGFFTTG